MAWHDRGMAWYGMAGHVNVGVWYWYDMAWSSLYLVTGVFLTSPAGLK